MTLRSSLKGSGAVTTLATIGKIPSLLLSDDRFKGFMDITDHLQLTLQSYNWEPGDTGKYTLAVKMSNSTGNPLPLPHCGTRVGICGTRLLRLKLWAGSRGDKEYIYES